LPAILEHLSTGNSRSAAAALSDHYGGLGELIDNSRQFDAEKVVETSPNKRYAKLNTVLGKGAYKVVYKAIDREEGYEVAWNVLQTTRAEYKELGHEIGILKSVRHPNIITFHDAWYSNAEFIFITELMTSGTLREYIRKLSLPNMKIVKRWARQILKGLVYLHSHDPPIIHRDIKCDNIFINGAHNEVKIGDMGTAEMKLGKKYTVIGTPEFMAPEMYEEKGYSEKVDIYAFGMCLLEMMTGEYPYDECNNAIQIYRKVNHGIKPESLSKVNDAEVLALINACLASEHERPSAQQVLEDSFLAVEPEVVLLTTNENKTRLNFQVVFKGMDKMSVKFEFNAESETAEDIVSEMIAEQVLPERYQQLIIHEINRILRELNKPEEDQAAKEENKVPWRRGLSSRMDNDELNRARAQLANTNQQLSDIRTQLVETEKQLKDAEKRERKFMELLFSTRDIDSSTLLDDRADEVAPIPSTSTKTGGTKLQKALQSFKSDKTVVDKTQSESTHAPPFVSSPPVMPQPIPLNSVPGLDLDRHGGSAPDSSSRSFSSVSAQDLQSDLDSIPILEYSDETRIDDIVRDTASATGRGMDKAQEWLKKLKNQDIMTVGDLRGLHDEDWTGIGLTVFALRALKNVLSGKRNRDPNTLGVHLQRSPQMVAKGDGSFISDDNMTL